MIKDSEKYKLPKINNSKDLIRGIINASYWHWNNINKEQHNRAIDFLNTLEAIDNAKPSEALEEIEKYIFNEWKQNHVNFGCDYKLEAELNNQLNNLKSIRQALETKSKKELAWEIACSHSISIDIFKQVNTNNSLDYEYYKTHWFQFEAKNIKGEIITEEEFELLKEMVKC